MRNIDIVGSWFSNRALYNGFGREWVQKLGSDETTTCFGGEKYTKPDGLTFQGEKGASPEDRNSQLLSHPKSLSPFYGPSGLPLMLWMISVVIYSSLPFILLLYLSVIYAHTRVHVPSATLSGAL